MSTSWSELTSSDADGQRNNRSFEGPYLYLIDPVQVQEGCRLKRPRTERTSCTTMHVE